MRWWNVVALVLVWMWFSITTVAAFVLMGRQPDVSVGFCLGVWLMPMCFGLFVWQQTRVVIEDFRRWRHHSEIK